ncbi:MAG: DUF1801 domain-containing protein [Bryobacteraceae bacterium]|nr:DUF1801 domain-containing protein [Bryobacteraceae bacterium]
MTPFHNAAVARAFEGYPPHICGKLLALRELLFETAASTEGVGRIEETLKWRQPAYITSETRSGTAIRIDWKKSEPSRYAMYFHCQTRLVETFRMMFPNELTFEGTRALVFDQAETVPLKTLALCVAAALTYHRTTLPGFCRRGSGREIMKV